MNVIFYFTMIRPPPISTLFPYTTLFRSDVMPVFMKAGCNTGSCHGAARGKDSFRLSLFGFDPDGDHYRLTREQPDRKSTRLNSSHSQISYAVFCLKKKKKINKSIYNKRH